MDIRVESIVSNSSLKFHDIIEKIEIAKNEYSTMIKITTKDENIKVDCLGEIYSKEYQGKCIQLTSIIDGYDIDMEGFEKMFEHTNYFNLELVAIGLEETVPKIVQIKNEFFINFIPNEKYFSTENMKEIKIS